MKKKSSENDPWNDQSSDPFADAARGLNYISETDAEILPFRGEKAEAVTSGELLRQTGHDNEANVEEISPDAFFAPLTRVQDWFDDSRRSQATRFAALYDELRSKLRDLHVFRVGSVRIDIFVVGLDAEGRLAGVKTKAVET